MDVDFVTHTVYVTDEQGLTITKHCAAGYKRGGLPHLREWVEKRGGEVVSYRWSVRAKGGAVERGGPFSGPFEAPYCRTVQVGGLP